MRFAFGSFSAPQASLPDLLRLARDYGYDGIEPRIGLEHGHGIELTSDPTQRTEVRRIAESSGVALACVDTSCRLADPTIATEEVEAAEAAIGLAADIGSPRIRVFGGRLPDGTSRDDGRQTLVSALRRLAPPANRHRVTICVETHDDWSDPNEVAAVMNAVDDATVRALWDVMHPVRRAGFSMAEAYAVLAPWVDHVHVHDGVASTERLEFRPIGAGDYDHREVLRVLDAGGYEGFVSGEWIRWEPAETHLPRELATLRRYLAELS